MADRKFESEGRYERRHEQEILSQGNPQVIDQMRRQEQSIQGTPAHKQSIWYIFGAGILILLLLVWIFIAGATGDTDVAASIPLLF